MIIDMKKKKKIIKLRINPKNVETRVGTLASPEAWQAKKEKRKKTIENILNFLETKGFVSQSPEST